MFRLVSSHAKGGRTQALTLRVLAALLALVGSVGADDHAAASSPPGSIEFTGRNLFATAEGRFHRWRVVARELDADALPASFVVVEVDLASVDTGNERRDEHLRSDDFFDVETHPIARVRVDSARRIEAEGAAGERYAADFEIDLHGVRKTIEGEIERVERSPLVFEGSLTLDRMDFGIGPKPSRWNPLSIKPEIPVRFRIELDAR